MTPPLQANPAAASPTQKQQQQQKQKQKQKQVGRPAVPRIIPAIPHRFARPPAATRPITPDESTTAAAVPQPEPTPQPAQEKQPERAATLLQTPPTPDSKVSAASIVDAEESVLGLADSPARSGDDLVEEAINTRAASGEHGEPQLAHDVPSRPPLQSTTAALSGNRPKPTVPAELPPEFYPREKSMAHTPVAEVRESPAFPPPASVSLHRLHPSVEGLVFGGSVQESPAMPSTPQEFEPEIPASQSVYARAPPGFPPHLAPQFFPGHSHHPSDPAASWMQPAYSMAPPPEVIYGNGHDYASPSFPPGSAPHQASYQAPFPLQTAPLALNGTTTSHTQSPSKSQFGDAKTASNLGEDHGMLYANGTASHRFEAPNEGYDLARHSLGFLGNPEFTDYILHIRSRETLLLSVPVHAVFVSRSPVILEALRRSAPPPFRTKDPRRLVDVLTDDAFVTTESLHEALKILYGGPLLSPSFLFGLSPYDRGSEQGFSFNDARKRMEQVLSYAAAGRFLQIPGMQTCGLRIAKALLRWDTVDQVLRLGLTANKPTVQPSTSNTDNGLLETYAVPLLDDALEFIAYNFPSDFVLYAIAPEMRQYPRLPTVVEQRQPTHNPRLSKIRFGDAPPEDDLKPNHITQVLSSILLSLPLPLLDRLFSHPAAANQIGWSGLTQLMRDVVVEREDRRQKALKADLRLSYDGHVPRYLLQNLHTEESVEPSLERSSGFILTAKRMTEHV